MYEAVNLQLVNAHEKTKCCDACDKYIELPADMRFQIGTLQALLDLPDRLICTPLGPRAMLAELLQRRQAVAEAFGRATAYQPLERAVH